MLRPPEPVLVVDLLPVERRALLDLLDGLEPDDWDRPTIAGDWTVKDIAAHLVADDLGRLSGQRDGHREEPIEGETLKDFIDRRNREWVVATRRLSPRVIRSLLGWSAAETQALFEALDPYALGGPVSWAGPDPAPVWLDVARELTERWHHQQQVRDAVGAPSLDDPTILRPVLATFAFALPMALEAAQPEAERAVHVTVDGPAGGDWTVRAEDGRWRLWLGRPDTADARIRLDADTAWRMYVRALSPGGIERRAMADGDPALVASVLRAFALVS